MPYLKVSNLCSEVLRVMLWSRKINYFTDQNNLFYNAK